METKKSEKSSVPSEAPMYWNYDPNKDCFYIDLPQGYSISIPFNKLLPKEPRGILFYLDERTRATIHQINPADLQYVVDRLKMDGRYCFRLDHDRLIFSDDNDTKKHFWPKVQKKQ